MCLSLDSIKKHSKITQYTGKHKILLNWNAYMNSIYFFEQEYCNKDVDWYKSVKQTQGSVQVTSFGQMNNILCYGRYIIGGIQGETVRSIHDVIHLKLEESDKPLSKKSYSLDELRDLESKLVLITGDKAKNRIEVEQYLNVS